MQISVKGFSQKLYLIYFINLFIKILKNKEMDFYQNSPLTDETKTHSTKSIGVLVAIVVVLIIIAIALVLYKGGSSPTGTGVEGLTDEQRANMIKALEEEEVVPLTAEQRTNMVEALAEEEVVPLTDEQRANMIEALQAE
jgi:hypothetical protein